MLWVIGLFLWSMGIAGTMRSMLVYNPEAVWPETLSSAAMIKALHENNHNYMPDDDSSSTKKSNCLEPAGEFLDSSFSVMDLALHFRGIGCQECCLPD